VLLILGSVAILAQSGPFTAQIENFWRLIATGGRTFTAIKVTGGTITGATISGGTITPGAGSITNAMLAGGIAFSNLIGTDITFADGTAALPGVRFTSETGLGFRRRASQILTLETDGSVGVMDFDTITNSEHLNMKATGIFGFSSGNADVAAADSAFSRLGAASIAVGNGTAGDFTGTIKLGTLNAVTAIQANGVAGATHAACSVSVTAITVTNGIITSITCT
jgi:hypothetical protein